MKNICVISNEHILAQEMKLSLFLKTKDVYAFITKVTNITLSIEKYTDK